MLPSVNLALSLVGLAMAGCVAGRVDAPGAARPAASNAVQGADMAGDLQAMVRAALEDAARRAPGGAPAPTLISAEHVTWPDGSLGCPMPGRVYTMALVRGYRIRIRSGADELDYHAGERGVPFLCPAGRATSPAPDTRIY
jgi:hypothetical protein